jgi:serine/threonine protein kinase
VNRVGVDRWVESYVLDLSRFEETPNISSITAGSGSESGSRVGSEVSVRQYSRRSDGFQIVVKSFNIFGCEKMNEVLYDLFVLTQLKHQCIAPVMGVVLPTESTRLQTATLYYCCGSLQEVKADNPVWWTSTTKSKAIAGIALGMRSAHRMGIVHGSLNPNNILFDDDHCVHSVDFCSNRFEVSSGRERKFKPMS